MHEGYERKYGSRCEVFEGRTQMTVNGLTKNDLVKSKTGAIVSKKKQAIGYKLQSKYPIKRLMK